MADRDICQGRPPVLVGVKYCGGCNERYDRMGAYRQIVSQCAPEAVFEAVAGREGTTFDLILVLCGCQAQCPNISGLRSRHGFFSLYQDTDPGSAVKRIRELRAAGIPEATVRSTSV